MAGTAPYPNYNRRDPRVFRPTTQAPQEYAAPVIQDTGPAVDPFGNAQAAVDSGAPRLSDQEKNQLYATMQRQGNVRANALSGAMGQRGMNGAGARGMYAAGMADVGATWGDLETKIAQAQMEREMASRGQMIALAASRADFNNAEANRDASRAQAQAGLQADANALNSSNRNQAANRELSAFDSQVNADSAASSDSVREYLAQLQGTESQNENTRADAAASRNNQLSDLEIESLKSRMPVQRAQDIVDLQNVAQRQEDERHRRFLQAQAETEAWNRVHGSGAGGGGAGVIYGQAPIGALWGY